LELQIHPKNGNKLGLLAGRDIDELRWLATRMRQALGQSYSDSGVCPDPYEADQPEQPADSRVRVEQQPNSVVLTVPPAGLLRGSKGMFGAGLFCCAFMVLFTTIVLFIGVGDAVFLAFAVLFWGIGIGLVLGGINMGRRRAVLAVVNDTLMIYQTDIFRSIRHE